MQQYNREHVKHIPILPEKETRDTHTHTHTQLSVVHSRIQFDRLVSASN